MANLRIQRRKIIQLALSGAASALMSPTASSASDKMTRAQAEYQDSPKGIYSCAVCSLFEPPSSCKVVDGEVSKDGWCKAFALAD